MPEEESKNEEKSPKTSQKTYLGIMFNCCGIYSRIYKNKEGTAYVGRCPKCMRNIKVPVGEGGTNQRFFNAE
jgi:hypothetical protein